MSVSLASGPANPAAVDRAAAPASAPVRLEPLPLLAGMAPMDVAEAFRDLPGLALLESARPGRNARWTYLTADPLAILDRPSPGADPFRSARELLARMGTERSSQSAPPFLGGLVGFVGYELGARLLALPDRAPTLGDPARAIPPMHLGLYDWVIAWDRRDGQAWLGGRAVDGDAEGLARRMAAVHARLDELLFGRLPFPRAGDVPTLTFRSQMSRAGWLEGVEAVREAIARGEIYQANLTRRLEAPFGGDPWTVYRHVRTGDPALFAAYLDLGGRPLAIPVRLSRAIPGRGRGGPHHDRSDQGHAAARPFPPSRPRADRGAARLRQGPRRERHDRRRPAQRPRSGLPCRARVRVPRAHPPGAHGRHPASRVGRSRATCGRASARSTCSRRRSRAGRITGAPKLRAMPSSLAAGDRRPRTVHRRPRLDRS